MQMTYEIIYKALKEVGLENMYEPQDYLNFFCLGNREAPDREDNLEAINSTSAKTTPQVIFPSSSACLITVSAFSFPNVMFPFMFQALARKSRRFMIYVHSKGMIVDDEYIICI
jgi:phospholipase D1/2